MTAFKKAACEVTGIPGASDLFKEAFAFYGVTFSVVAVIQLLSGNEKMLYLIGVFCALSLLFILVGRCYLQYVDSLSFNFRDTGGYMTDDKTEDMEKSNVVQIRPTISIAPGPPPESVRSEEIKMHMLESLAFVRQKVEAGHVRSLAVLWDDSVEEMFMVNMSANQSAVLIAMFEVAKAQVLDDLRRKKDDSTR